MFAHQATARILLQFGIRLPSSLAVFWLLFYTAIIASWLAIWLLASIHPAAGFTGMPADFWASMCLSADQVGFAPVLAMWALMVAAMMLPGMVPSLLVFRDLASTGATSASGLAALLGGYLCVWMLVSIPAAALQQFLASRGFLDPTGASLSPFLAAGLLVLAGLIQFSALKTACVEKCRMPLSFFMQHWAPGLPRAALIGVKLGWICVGCCWALMALAFVGGTMNLLWMGAATLFMTLEKLPEIGRYLTRPTGYILLALGALTLLTA